MKGYKTIPTHPHYAVSKGGRVIRRKDNKVMKQSAHRGYLSVSVDGKSVLVHRLVAETYLTTEPLAGRHIHHINGDKKDNRTSNLVVCESRKAHNYEHFIVREYFKHNVAHTKKFRAFRDMMLARGE